MLLTLGTHPGEIMLLSFTKETSDPKMQDVRVLRSIEELKQFLSTIFTSLFLLSFLLIPGF
jgi:hypothetical protein